MFPRFHSRFPRECVFPNLPLSYCTYDEGSKFSGAISSKRRETIPRKDPPVAGLGDRNVGRNAPWKISDFRKRGRKEITYVPILAESREDLAIPLVLLYPSHPPPSLSSLQLSECPRRSSFVDRSSRFSLEYLTFVSARTDRLCPGGIARAHVT